MVLFIKSLYCKYLHTKSYINNQQPFQEHLEKGSGYGINLLYI